MKDSLSNKKIIYGAASVALLVVIWEIASIMTGSDQILPGPWATICATLKLFAEKDFLAVVGSTLLRGLAGFAIALAAGVATGILGGLNDTFHAFMKPWITVIRATPVIAFVLLALIWFESNAVPVFIGILTMFPLVYLNIVEGIRSVDPDIVEMAEFYNVGRHRLIREVYLPSIEPFAVSGISSAVGIGWRAIVVGEVLSVPQYGIGTVMHSAQTFLQVDVLIAWTLITILFGALFERIIRLAQAQIAWRSQSCH